MTINFKKLKETLGEEEAVEQCIKIAFETIKKQISTNVNYTKKEIESIIDLTQSKIVISES